MRCRQIRIYDFTKRELEVFLQRANFTPNEETLFFTKKQKLYIRTGSRRDECK